MLPYILAAVGGYLIGDSLKGKQYAENYSDGGRISKGVKWKQEWTDTKGVEGYDLLEIEDTKYFSNNYRGGIVVRSRIIESSKPERVGNYQEDSKTELRKIFSGKYPFAYKYSEGELKGNRFADGGIAEREKMKVISARIKVQLFHNQVWVTTEDNKEQFLFDYNPNEIRFTPYEFIGLTLDECENLKFVKKRESREQAGQKSNLKDVYSDLRSRIGGLRINEERDTEIQADVRNWGNWEHDYEDYDRDEDDFEDDDSMILSDSSYKKMNEIVNQVIDKYPDVEIQWDTSEKNYIDFTISHKKKMAKGGKVNAISESDKYKLEIKFLQSISKVRKGDINETINDLKKALSYEEKFTGKVPVVRQYEKDGNYVETFGESTYHGYDGAEDKIMLKYNFIVKLNDSVFGGRYKPFDTREDALNSGMKIIKEWMAKGGQIYKLGDKWSPNFDYTGMLETALKAQVSWGMDKLRKLYDSFEDVNYHTANRSLWEALKSLKDNDVKAAEKHLENFRADVMEEMK